MAINAWPISKAWPGAAAWPGGVIVDPNYPATLANLAMWIDGRAQTYSDAAGTVPSSAPAGRVRSIAQSSPASGLVTAASTALSPYRESAALNFEVGGSHAMAAPIATAYPQNALTIGLSFVMRDNFPGGPQYLICNGTTLQVLTFSNNIILIKYNGGTNWYVVPVGTPTAYATAPLGSRVALTLSITGTGMALSLVVDGTRTDYTLADTIANTSLPGANWLVGWDGASLGCELHGALGQLVVVSRNINSSENASLLAFLSANAPTAYCPTAIPLVMVTGDSIARGLLLEPNRSLIWSYIAQQTLNATQPANMVNAAISGSGIANQTAAYPLTMGPFYNAARSRNIFVGAIGTNDMATLSHDGPTTLADYYTYMDMAKAVGWRIVACTILPRSGTGHDAAFNTARAYFNTHVRAEWASRGYYGLADVAGISGMGADGADSNTTYYVDNIHPTFAGDALMAPVYAAAIQAAM